jgi:UDP-N-acetylmuramate--alanine ligase
MKNLLRRKENIYFIGIEGAGTSALALMYKNMGYNVSGSDNGDRFYRKALVKNDIEVFEKYDSENIPKKVKNIVYSTSIKEDNPEYKKAKKDNLEMKSYPEALADIFNEKMGIAVCGTHGKTTTTAMLSQALKDLDLDPSAIVGSRVIEWKANSLTGKGEYFVIEADEYQNKLRHYNPWSVILTSVDYDHPDFY